MKPQTYQNLGVLAANINDLSEEAINYIIAIDWFEPKEKFNCGVIFLVDKNQLSPELADFVTFSPHDCGLTNPQENVKIDNCLKRWNSQDGFYHV